MFEIRIPVVGVPIEFHFIPARIDQTAAAPMRMCYYCWKPEHGSAICKFLTESRILTPVEEVRAIPDYNPNLITNTAGG